MPIKEIEMHIRDFAFLMDFFSVWKRLYHKDPERWTEMYPTIDSDMAFNNYALQMSEAILGHQLRKVNNLQTWERGEVEYNGDTKGFTGKGSYEPPDWYKREWDATRTLPKHRFFQVEHLSLWT